nr:protein trichome birefringence-like 34 [Tanacetum cinerariifolium]
MSGHLAELNNTVKIQQTTISELKECLLKKDSKNEHLESKIVEFTTVQNLQAQIKELWSENEHLKTKSLYDGKAVIERLRDKKILFVGDSLGRNQWMSMICMLRSTIPGVKNVGKGLNCNLHTFRATDYNISIDFYWAPMLVESNGDISSDHHRDNRIVRIEAIEKKATHWVDADILCLIPIIGGD